MKYEELLKIYWTKGYLIDNELSYFHQITVPFTNNFFGMRFFTANLFLQRLEISLSLLAQEEYTYEWNFLERLIFNKWLSSMISVTNHFKKFYHKRLEIYYKLKLYKYRRQVLGYPSRGQRTWSNAWTSYYITTPLKQFFFSEMKKNVLNKQDITYSTDKRVRLLKKKNTIKIKKIYKKKTKNALKLFFLCLL